MYMERVFRFCMILPNPLLKKVLGWGGLTDFLKNQWVKSKGVGDEI